MTFDLFELFRTCLFVAVTVYSVLVLAVGYHNLRRLLDGQAPGTRLVRGVLGYLVATVSLRPIVGELWQIAGLTLLLSVLWWGHALLETGT